MSDLDKIAKEFGGKIQLNISNMSKILGVHQRTLRIWDEKGVLPSKRTLKNRRYYFLEDIERGKIVLLLTRRLALNLMGVRIMLAFLEINNFSKDKIKFILEAAKHANIDKEVQQENIKKNLKRGKKKNLSSFE